MYNTGGAVDEFKVQQISSNSGTQSPTVIIELKVRGNGRFGVYSSQQPSKYTVDGVETDFTYDSETGLLITTLPLPQEEMYRWSVEIEV